MDQFYVTPGLLHDYSSHQRGVFGDTMLLTCLIDLGHESNNGIGKIDIRC